MFPQLIVQFHKKVVGCLLQLSPTPNPQLPMDLIPHIIGVLCLAHPHLLDFQDGNFLHQLFKMPQKNKSKKPHLLANNTMDAFQDIVEGDKSEYEQGIIGQMQLQQHNALCNIYMRLLHFGETKSFIYIVSAKCIIYLRDYRLMFTKISNVTPFIYQGWTTSIEVRKMAMKILLSSEIVNQK